MYARTHTVCFPNWGVKERLRELFNRKARSGQGLCHGTDKEGAESLKAERSQKIATLTWLTEEREPRGLLQRSSVFDT